MLCQRIDGKSEEFGSVCPDQNRFRKCVSDLIQLFCRLSADRLNFLKLSELRNRNGRPMFPGVAPQAGSRLRSMPNTNRVVSEHDISLKWWRKLTSDIYESIIIHKVGVGGL